MQIKPPFPSSISCLFSNTICEQLGSITLDAWKNKNLFSKKSLYIPDMDKAQDKGMYWWMVQPIFKEPLGQSHQHDHTLHTALNIACRAIGSKSNIQRYLHMAPRMILYKSLWLNFKIVSRLTPRNALHDDSLLCQCHVVCCHSSSSLPPSWCHYPCWRYMASIFDWVLFCSYVLKYNYGGGCFDAVEHNAILFGLWKRCIGMKK